MTRVADVLVIDEIQEGRGALLAERLRRLSLGVACASSIATTHRFAQHPDFVLRAALVDADFPAMRLALAPLRSRLIAGAVTPVVVGDRTRYEHRNALVKEGFHLALWRPFDDQTLRFQMNRALGSERRSGPGRKELRAPVAAKARVSNASRTKEAQVYSLSRHGVFLETPCPSPSGAKVEVALLLPQGPISLAAQVVHTNVPGNIQRSAAPIGMGVRFTDSNTSLLDRLESIVRERDDALSL